MQAVKETAANIAASALSGMEKTKAVIEEKVEIITTSDPIEKDMATLRKEDRIRLAELRKQEAYNQNAAAAVHGGGPGSPTFTAAGHVIINSPQKNQHPFHNNNNNATAHNVKDTTNKQSATVQSSATVAKVEHTNAMTG